MDGFCCPPPLQLPGLRATASNSSSCRLLFSPRPPPSRLLVSSVIAPDPDNDNDNDNDDAVSAASTATTTTARVCCLRDWASRCPYIISPSSSLSLMSSSSSQPCLRTLPHRCRRDRRRPPMERPHSHRAILAGAVVIVLVVVALRR